ncbi:sulfite exporter TauE/SafE family protein [Hoeflea prorocentri]|uniref:Probable membrane transporter protein n=1 Tax=Hoeflea prorocentri TaxID=1922333 RepID=A0A9X3ULM5_9HYPH|nr:sulfite exporter TauE/SafE family protein [Hoeflea prorocentri]MCY6382867.1 sulfite exporter TauE/SafE family protein [Hoeflea prorocentri]MDA5400667.1 sulfite exporter TauE/SafE family protein [Hoeflea prorocentri]
MFDTLLISVAAFLAGGLNAIAGGGSFLTFPALVFAGVPTIAANATSAVAVFPGYLSGALGFTSELRTMRGDVLAVLLGLSVVGGVAGSLLLLVTPEAVFSFIVPWLLGFATLLFAFGRRIATWTERHFKAQGMSGNMLVLMVSTYGGYFNGGLGIVLMAVFSILGLRDINQMNGLKNAMSFCLSAASVATFALAGIVHWPQAIIMMIAATVGGYCGALLARFLSEDTVRATIVVIGLITTVVFAARV